MLIVGGLESLGLFAVDCAMAAGQTRVDYVDAHEGRREAAQRLGAHVHPDLPDAFVRAHPVVIGASRDPAMLRAAILCLTPNGHLSNLAIYFQDTPLPLWEMFLRGVTVSLGLPNSGPHIPAVLELARCGHIHPERLITTHAWEDAPVALLGPDIKPVMVRPRLVS